jgi:hypothetical protein
MTVGFTNDVCGTIYVSDSLMKYWSIFIVNDCGRVFLGPSSRTTSEQEERSKAAAQAHLIQVSIAVCPSLKPWAVNQVDKAVCHWMPLLLAGLVYLIDVLTVSF